MSRLSDRLGWVPHAFSLELRRIVSYRADFWMHLAGTLTAELTLAYFLWKAMFAARGAAEMGGYSFRGMMLYYLLVPLVARLIRGEENRAISDDIYEGGLTRYLVYPLSFLEYKYLSLLATSCVAAVQIGLALGIFGALYGFPAETRVGAQSLAQGLSLSLAATGLYFLMGACVELVSFWQDSVWGLLGMLRMSLVFLGGGLIPLSLFPERMRSLLHWLPFEYLVSLPIRCFLGQASLAEWLRGFALIGAWAAVFALIAGVIWRRGTRQYSGVGL